MRRILLFIPLFVFAFFTQSYAVEDSYTSNYEYDYQYDEEYEKNFREAYGLEIETLKLFNLLSENYHPQSIEQFGLRLTVQEYDSLVKRIDLQKEKLPVIESYLKENYGSNFDVLYIDQKNGGIIKVGFKEEIPDVNSLEQVLSELYEGQNLFEFYLVQYSVDELTSLQQKIDEHYEMLLLEGIELLYTSRNIPQERIEVGIMPYNNKSINVIEELFDPEMLIVRESMPLENVSRTAYTRPVIGGLRILNHSRGGTSSTSAFSFIKKWRSLYFNCWTLRFSQ